MRKSINGFYAAYLTGNSGQGLAMVIFRNGQIIGVDTGNAKYDGKYSEVENGFAVKLSISFPPNTILVQGGITGDKGDNSEISFQLPQDFWLKPFMRIDAKHGAVNVKFVKLREFDE